MSALDGIKARLAAQKAAAAQTAAPSSGAQLLIARRKLDEEASMQTTAPSNAAPAPAQEPQASVPSLGAGKGEVATSVDGDTNSTSRSSELLGGGKLQAGPNVQAAVDPRLAGLSGVQLLIARKKLAEENAKAGKGAKPNSSAGSHSGIATGTGSSVATEVTKPQLAQAVLTPAQRAMEEAKSILQRKEGEGFYNIPPANAARLPQDLPADVVSERLRELDAALVLRTPDLARLTIEINRNLRQYDELAYLLQDEQLGLIVQANLTIKNTELIATKAKGSSVAKRNEKIAASLTADDI